MGIIINCKDCPFNGQDNVYCRTCSIPYTNRKLLRKWLRKQSAYYRVSFSYGWGVWVSR